MNQQNTCNIKVTTYTACFFQVTFQGKYHKSSKEKWELYNEKYACQNGGQCISCKQCHWCWKTLQPVDRAHLMKSCPKLFWVICRDTISQQSDKEPKLLKVKGNMLIWQLKGYNSNVWESTLEDVLTSGSILAPRYTSLRGTFSVMRETTYKLMYFKLYFNSFHTNLLIWCFSLLSTVWYLVL